MTVGERILHQLLDSYEKSNQYRGTASGQRRLFFRFSAKTLPDYYSERSSQAREKINAELTAYERQGLIQLIWVRFEEGHELAKVAMSPEQVELVYAHLGREPRLAVEKETLARIQYWQQTVVTPWISDFLVAMAARVEQHQSLSPYLESSDLALTDQVMRALVGLATLSEETPERVFSLRVLGYSKSFRGLRGRVVHILRDYFPQAQEYLDEDPKGRTLLAELGLVDNPQHLYLSGPLVLSNDGTELDLNPIKPAIGLPIAFVEHAEPMCCTAQAVLTVENLTSFYQAAQAYPQWLVIYLGGFHNRPRRELLQKLHALVGDTVPFYHWGDLDWGGFSIFVHLRRRTGIPFAPYLMDLETLTRWEEHAVAFEESYARRLDALLADADYQPFHELIQYMLARGIRLEQESIELGTE